MYGKYMHFFEPQVMCYLSPAWEKNRWWTLGKCTPFLASGVKKTKGVKYPKGRRNFWGAKSLTPESTYTYQYIYILVMSRDILLCNHPECKRTARTTKSAVQANVCRDKYPSTELCTVVEETASQISWHVATCNTLQWYDHGQQTWERKKRFSGTTKWTNRKTLMIPLMKVLLHTNEKTKIFKPRFIESATGLLTSWNSAVTFMVQTFRALYRGWENESEIWYFGFSTKVLTILLNELVFHESCSQYVGTQISYLVALCKPAFDLYASLLIFERWHLHPWSRPCMKISSEQYGRL